MHCIACVLQSGRRSGWKKTNAVLRGAWRNHYCPSPFSWLLQKTELEKLKTGSAYARKLFSLKRPRATERHSRRWITAAIDGTTVHARQRCRKPITLAVTFLIFGFIWEMKSYCDQQSKFQRETRVWATNSVANRAMAGAWSRNFGRLCCYPVL